MPHLYLSDARQSQRSWERFSKLNKGLFYDEEDRNETHHLKE
jgi:hypothetical protein